MWGTNQVFFLGRFLQLHGIDARDVTLVNSGALSAGVDSFASGDVDAIITFDPYLHTMQG